jgi:hypothetical protein
MTMLQFNAKILKSSQFIAYHLEEYQFCAFQLSLL